MDGSGGGCWELDGMEESRGDGEGFEVDRDGYFADCDRKEIDKVAGEGVGKQ